MNTPNPLVPQGTLDRQSKGKSTARIAIFTIVSIHAVFFTGLLMQGCRRDDTKLNSVKAADAGSTNQNALPPLDSSPGYYASTTDVVQASNSLPPLVNIPPAASELTSPPPASLPSVVSEPAPEGKPYKISKGDTLAKIAKANGVTLNAVVRANPKIEPSKLKVGQTIQIPASSPTGGLGFVEPGKSDATGSSETNVHTVRAGETLTRIAKQHKVSVKALQAANGLKTQRVVVGQKLKLPAGTSSNASADSGKISASSKLTATNPAYISPMPSATPTNMR